MLAIFSEGGFQHKAKVGQILRIQKVEKEVGSVIDFDKVLLIAKEGTSNFGAPYVKGAVVKAEVLKHFRADKIKVIKFKRRKHHMKQMGHRQYHTEIKITDIKG